MSSVHLLEHISLGLGSSSEAEKRAKKKEKEMRRILKRLSSTNAPRPVSRGSWSRKLKRHVLISLTVAQMLEFFLGFVAVLVLNRLLNWRSLGRGPVRQKFTAFHGREEIVVFLIGTKVNSWWSMLKLVWRTRGAILRFFPLGKKNFESMDVLRNAGMLGSHAAGGLMGILFGSGSITVQYWESHEKLVEYSSKQRNHLDSMRQYFADVELERVFSIWHEMYVVKHEYENVYGSAALFGLAAIPGAQIIDIDRTTAHLKTGMGRKKHAMENEI